MSTRAGELARLDVNIGSDTREVLSGFARVSQAAEQMAKDIQRAGRSLEGFGRSLSIQVTAPLTGIAALATKATADFETAMVGVAKTVDAPAEAIQALGRHFQAVSERIPVAANELAKIAEEAGQLGIAIQNIPEFAEVVAGLRVSTNLADEAATTLARFANIMGTAQTEFDRMGSTIVALGNNLATTEREIAEMALRIAGAGRQIGFTEAQVLAFAGALSSVGIAADAGGSALSRTMIRIASAVDQGGDKLRLFASVAGMSADEFARRFREDAAGAIQAFIAGLATVEQRGVSALRVLDELGLTEIRVRDMLLRSSSAAGVLTNALQIGATAWEENNALTDEASRFYERLAAQFQVLRNRLVNITAEFGDALRPAIDQAVEVGHRLLNVARELVQWFGRLDEETRVQVTQLGVLVAAIGPVAAVAGVLVKAFGFIVGLVNPVTVALAAIAGAIVAIRNNWLGMGEAASRAWNTLLDVVPRVITAVGNVVKPWLNILIASFHTLGSIAVIVWDEYIREPAIRAFRAIRDWARPVLTAIATAFEHLGRLGERAAAAIRNAFVDAAEGAEDEGATIGQRIADAIVDNFSRDYVGVFVRVVSDGLNRARELVMRAIERLRSMAVEGGALQELEDAALALSEVASSTDLSNMPVQADRDFRQLARTVEGLAGAFADTLGGAIKDVRSAFASFAQYVMRTLASLVARFLVFKAALSFFGGGPLAGLFGESFLGFRIPGRAMGGPVQAGRAYVVGERGPELFVPRQSGTVVPNEAMARPVVVSIPAPPPSPDPFVAARDAWWQRVIAETMRQLESAGALRLGTVTG